MLSFPVQDYYKSGYWEQCYDTVIIYFTTAGVLNYYEIIIK